MATIVTYGNPLDPVVQQIAENIKHAADVREQERRAEVRRRFKRIQRLNAEAERRANGWEPGFHNRIRGLKGR